MILCFVITTHESLPTPSKIVYISTDLNPFATHCTLLTGQHNSVPLQPIQTDLLISLIPRINHSVDVLVFNPPYVETEEEEMISAQEVGIIERSWAGGKEGMGVTGRVLEIVEVSFNFFLKSNKV